MFLKGCPEKAWRWETGAYQSNPALVPLKLHCILRASNISLKALALFYIASNLHLIYLIHIWNFGLLLVIADWQAACSARIVQLGNVLRHCRPAKVVAIDNIYWMTIYEIYVVSQYTIYISSPGWLQYNNPYTHYQTVQPSSIKTPLSSHYQNTHTHTS